MGRAILYAQSAKRALAGEEIPGDAHVVLLGKRNRFRRAHVHAGFASGAQTWILLDQPTKGRRAWWHVIGSPRPGATTEVPPDDIENTHWLLPLPHDGEDHRCPPGQAAPNPIKSKRPLYGETRGQCRRQCSQRDQANADRKVERYIRD